MCRRALLPALLFVFTTALLMCITPSARATALPAHDLPGSRDNPIVSRFAGSVIVGRWKLVGNQLFDLASDPYEKSDVAAQHPKIVGQLKAQVARFSAERKVSRDA